MRKMKNILQLGLVACSIGAMACSITGWVSGLVVAFLSFRLLKAEVKFMLRNLSRQEMVEGVVSILKDPDNRSVLPWGLGLFLAIEAAFAGIILFLGFGGLLSIPDIGGVLGAVWAATFLVAWKGDTELCVNVFNEALSQEG